MTEPCTNAPSESQPPQPECGCQVVVGLGSGEPIAIRDDCLDHKNAGEGPCMDCGTLNTPAWFTDNETWNAIVGGPGTRYDPGGFLCPWCFTQRAYAAGLSPTRWRLIPEFPWRWDETASGKQA